MHHRNRGGLERRRQALRRSTVAMAALGVVLLMAMGPGRDRVTALAMGRPDARTLGPDIYEDADVADAAADQPLLGYFQCGGCHHIAGSDGIRSSVPMPGVPRSDGIGPWPDAEIRLLRWNRRSAGKPPVTPSRLQSPALPGARAGA